jgi:hypothetical protein
LYVGGIRWSFAIAARLVERRYYRAGYAVLLRVGPLVYVVRL